jgi:hypothetical protein
LEEFAEAGEKARLASENFNTIISEVPSAIPHPDGVQHIRTASQEHTTAREAAMAALRRLNDFVIYGTIPDDLK